MNKLANSLKKIWPVIILLALGLFAVKTLFGPGYFDGHDAQAHLVRLYQYDLALKDGQILPAIAGDLYGGKGYPVFIFAYPLPYLIAEGFHLAGFSLAAAIKSTFIVSYLLTGLSMYWFGLLYWRSRLAAFTSAILWTWAPYMFVKVIITASLGVTVAYIFVPLTFIWLYRVLTRAQPKDVIWLSLSLAGIILSHLITLVIFAPLMVLFAFWHGGYKKLKTLLFAGLLTLGLVSFYLLPAILELPLTHYAEFVQNQYAQQFVSFLRLFYSPWGTNAPGWGSNPLSQQVGIAQWLAVGLAAIVGWRVRKLWSFVAGFGLSIFLMLPISKFVWDLLTPLQSVNTPWRFLSLAIFTSAVLSGYLATVKTKWSYLVLVVVIALAIYGNRNHLRINERVDYSDQWLSAYTGVATAWNEHLPIWIKEVDFDEPAEKVMVWRGECNLSDGEYKSNLKILDANCPGDAILQLNTAYYPGWKVWVDDQEATEEVKTRLEESNGLISFTVPAGQHQVRAMFTKTPLRKIAYLISLTTLGWLVIFGFRLRFWSRPR